MAISSLIIAVQQQGDVNLFSTYCYHEVETKDTLYLGPIIFKGDIAKY